MTHTSESTWEQGTVASRTSWTIRQRRQQTVEVRVVEMPVDDEDRSRSTRVPSVVAVDWRSRAASKPYLVGWEFLQAFSKKRRNASLLRRGVNYFPSVKSDMGTYKVYAESSLDDGKTPGQVTSLLLRRIREVVSSQVARYPIKDSRLTISVPASFTGLARQETLDALVSAGFNPERVELIDEPVAALVDLLNGTDAAAILSGEFKNILVFDYGAGTCDLSLVKARFNGERENGLEVINLAISAYRKLGGDDIDRAVMRAVVWPQILGTTPLSTVSSAERQAWEDTLTGTVARGLKERICRAVKEHLNKKKQWPLKGERIRQTYPLEPKFDGQIKTPTQFYIDWDAFADVMRPFVDGTSGDQDLPEQSLWTPVFETLERAGLRPDQLDVLLLHGGSSLNPFIPRMLRTATVNGRPVLSRACRIEQTPDVMTSVSRGAALCGYWRHARGLDFVRPIVSEDMGIVVIGGEGRPLVHAGQALPYPDEDGVAEVTAGEEHFVVPNGDAPELLVPVYTGKAEEPKIAGTIKVPIPAGTRDGAEVRIKLKISREKTLEWWFSIGSAEFERATSVEDPWTAKAETPAERRLAEHRREMRRLADAGQHISIGTKLIEGHLLRRAGHKEEALSRVNELIATGPPVADLFNLQGLILIELGDDSGAVSAFADAARLDSRNAVYLGNYGWQLAEVGRSDEAIGVMRAALSMDPTLSYLNNRLADLYRKAGDEVKARQELQRALQLTKDAIETDPFSVEEWRRLALIQFKLGEYEAAEQAWTQAESITRDEFYGGDSEAMIAPRFGRTTWRESEQ